jgi:hypothetical protein
LGLNCFTYSFTRWKWALKILKVCWECIRIPKFSSMQGSNFTLHAEQNENKNRRWQASTQISFHLPKHKGRRVRNDGAKLLIETTKDEARHLRKKNESNSKEEFRFQLP